MKGLSGNNAAENSRFALNMWKNSVRHMILDQMVEQFGDILELLSEVRDHGVIYAEEYRLGPQAVGNEAQSWFCRIIHKTRKVNNINKAYRLCIFRCIIRSPYEVTHFRVYCLQTYNTLKCSCGTFC